MCLENIIGISRRLDKDVPPSNIYLEDFEGITLKFADSAAETQVQTGVELIESKISLAAQLLKQEVNAHISNVLRQDTLLNYDTIGFHQENLKEIATVAGKRGVRVKIDKSAYLGFHVHSISLWLKDAITTNVEVWNIITGKKIKDFPITTVAGEPTEIILDELFLSNKQVIHLAFLYDSDNISYSTTTTKIADCCGRNHLYRNQYIESTGVTVDGGVLANNLKGTGETGGMTINYSIRCVPDNFICYNALAFAVPLAYMSAQLLVREAVYSKSQNYIVLSKHDLNVDLEKDLSNKYKKSISNILKNMRLPNDRCFRCAPPVFRKTELPG